MPVSVNSGVDRWVKTTGLEEARRQEALDREEQAARRPSIPYQAFPKQREFHTCDAKYRLFGGAAGPGKSKALLMEAIVQANDCPGANTLLLRKTFPELESSLLLYFRRDVPRELYRSYNKAKHLVTWLNGSTTRFGYSQTENDIYQYQSSEFLFIGIDELTHFTLRQWQFLTSRNRCPVRDSFPNMAGATNPGNIGHAWVKALFIDKQPAPGMDPREYDPADFAFISARVWDNPIYANDASYIKTLHQLPDYFRRAFLDGDWSVFAGQYFRSFDPSRSVIRAESIAAAVWWPRWISIDWGFEHPAAAYWHTSAPGTTLPFEGRQHRLEDSHMHGPGFGQAAHNAEFLRAGAAGSPKTIVAADRGSRVVTYREFLAQHLAPRALATTIVERSLAADANREKIDAIYLSPDAFARRTDESSIAEQMGDVFAAAGLPRPVPADNDRVGGWMLMYQMLEANEWLIADSCPELIRTLPELVRDPVNVEDIAKRDGDDAADAARYGLKSRASARPAKPPREQELGERITSTDPTIRAIQIKKANLDVRDSNAPVQRPGAKTNSRRRWPW